MAEHGTYTLHCMNCDTKTYDILRFQNAALCSRCNRQHQLSPELWVALIQHGQKLIPSMAVGGG